MRLSRGLVLALYNLALPPALLAALPASLLKMRRRGGYGPDLAQRFGLYRAELRACLAAMDKPCWVHAVSVGEVLVATKFIAALRRHRPDLPVVLSTTTSTGRALARKELPPDVPVLYNPLDLPGCVHRAMDAIRPGRLVLVEAEVWPNLVHIAKQSGLPVSLINARLSNRSERRYRLLRALVEPLFNLLDHVLVPEPEEVARWVSIGVRPEAIAVTGSLKHDYTGLDDDPRSAAFEALLGNLWSQPRPPLLLAASTHPGEEAALARVFLELRRDLPTLKWLIVPRHAERAAAVIAELTALGVVVVRRSGLSQGPPEADAAVGLEGEPTGHLEGHSEKGGQWFQPDRASRAAQALVDRGQPGRTAPPSPAGAVDALLIDTTGELRAWQPLADVVVIGKSFLATGGQNPVEALMAGRPVVAGPHMENFAPLMRSLLAHEAVIQVSGLDQLGRVLGELLRSPERGRVMARSAREALALHQHSADRTVRILFDEPGHRSRDDPVEG